MTPVLKYAGGKRKELPHFLHYVPDKFNRYVEPFFGGGALYFYLEPKEDIINDLNCKLMTFYRQLKEQFPIMRRQLDELQEIYEKNQCDYQAKVNSFSDKKILNDNETLYYKMRELFNRHNQSELDGYLASVVYFFVNKTAYSGLTRYNSRGDYNVPFGRYKNFNSKIITEQHSELLQRAELFNTDYEEIFDMLKEDDFVFLDPPYDCVFTDYGNDSFDEKQQRRLANNFRNLPCRALMIIGKTPLTVELYDEFVVGEYHKNYAVNIKNRFKNNKTHLVIKNY